MSSVKYAGPVTKFPALTVVLASAAILVGGCMGPTRQTIPADVTVKISDPTFKRVAEITEKVNLDAEGRLHPGKYSFRNVPLVIPADTSFTLALTLPVSADGVISSAAASGSLMTTRTITAAGLPVPRTLTIDRGKASADVDFVRALGAFLIQLLQQENGGGATEKMEDLLDDIDIKKASFVLRPGSRLNLFDLSGKIMPDSTIAFENLDCDKKMNYSGDCRVKVNLAEVLHSPAPALTAAEAPPQQLKAGVALVSGYFSAVRKDNDLRFDLKHDDQNKGAAIQLNQFECRSSKASIAGEHCDLAVGSCSIHKILQQEPIDYNLVSDIALNSGNVTIESPNKSLKATLPGKTSAKLTMQRTGVQGEWRAVTSSGVIAENAEIIILKPHSSANIQVGRADLGVLEFSNKNGLSVLLKQGKLLPTKVTWTGKKKFLIATMSGAELNLAHDMRFDINRERKLELEKLPVALNASSVEVKTATREWKFKNVQGTATVKADGDEIDVASSLKFALDSANNPFGVPDVPMTVQSLDITASKEAIQAMLRGCRMTLPAAKVISGIEAALPKKKSFELHKTILDGRKWRYRNLQIDEVDVIKPTIKTLAFVDKNTIKVSGESDIDVSGTVERYTLGFLPSTRAERGWSSHPWSADGHVDGSGEIDYKFAANGSMADSAIDYDLALRMKIPEDLSVDWSQVAGDILGKSEQMLMGSVVKHASHFVPEDGIPVKKSGSILLFPHSDKKMKDIKITSFTLTPSKDKLLIDFAATAAL